MAGSARGRDFNPETRQRGAGQMLGARRGNRDPQGPRLGGAARPAQYTPTRPRAGFSPVSRGTAPAPRARRQPHGRGHTSLRPRRPAPDHLMSRVPWRPPTSGSPSGVAPPSLPQRRRPVELSPRRARTRPRPPRPRRKWTPRVPASRGPFGHPQTLLGACSLQPGLRRAWASARGSWGAAGGPGRGPCPHPREGGREVEGTFLRVGEITTGVRSSPTSAHRRPFQRFL